MLDKVNGCVTAFSVYNDLLFHYDASLTIHVTSFNMLLLAIWKQNKVYAGHTKKRTLQH